MYGKSFKIGNISVERECESAAEFFSFPVHFTLLETSQRAIDLLLCLEHPTFLAMAVVATIKYA